MKREREASVIVQRERRHMTKCKLLVQGLIKRKLVRRREGDGEGCEKLRYGNEPQSVLLS